MCAKPKDDVESSHDGEPLPGQSQPGGGVNLDTAAGPAFFVSLRMSMNKLDVHKDTEDMLARRSLNKQAVVDAKHQVDTSRPGLATQTSTRVWRACFTRVFVFLQIHDTYT